MKKRFSKEKDQGLKYPDLNQEIEKFKENRAQAGTIREMIIDITGEGEQNRGMIRPIKSNQHEPISKVVVIPHSSSYQVILHQHEERKDGSDVYKKPLPHGIGYQSSTNQTEERKAKYDSQTYTSNPRSTSKQSQSKNRKVLPLPKANQRPLTPNQKDKPPYIKHIITNGVGLNFDTANKAKGIDLVSNTHFTNQRTTAHSPSTYKAKDNLFPLKKNSIMYGIYQKYSKRLSDYILRNQASIRLYGNSKYTNKDPVYYLQNKSNIDDLAKNDKETTRVITGSYVTKEDGNDLIHRYQMSIIERGGRVDLTPLPSKSRRRMKNQVEKEEFYEVERSVVSMRRFEYNKRIKTRYLYSQERGADRLPKIVFIQRWWRNVLYRRYILYQVIKLQSLVRGYLVRRKFHQDIQNDMADFVFSSLETFIRVKLEAIFLMKLKLLSMKQIVIPTEHKSSHQFKQKVMKGIAPLREIVLIQSTMRMYLMKKYLRSRRVRRVIRSLPLKAKQSSHLITRTALRRDLSYIVFIQRKWRGCIRLCKENEARKNNIIKKPIVQSHNSIITEKTTCVRKERVLKRPLFDPSLFTKEMRTEAILTHIKSTESLVRKDTKANDAGIIFKIVRIQLNWRNYSMKLKRRKAIPVHTTRRPLDKCLMMKTLKKSATLFLFRITTIQMHWRRIAKAKAQSKPKENELILTRMKIDQSSHFISKKTLAKRNDILHAITTIQLYWKHKYHLKHKDQPKPIQHMKNISSSAHTKKVLCNQKSCLLNIVLIQKWFKKALALFKKRGDLSKCYTKPKLSKSNGFYSRTRAMKPSQELPHLIPPKSTPYISTKTTLNKTDISKSLKLLQSTFIQYLSRKNNIKAIKLPQGSEKSKVSYCTKVITQPQLLIHQKVVLLPEISNKEVKVSKEAEIKAIQTEWKSLSKRKKEMNVEAMRANRFSKGSAYMSKERKVKEIEFNEVIMEKSPLRAICYLSKELKEKEEMKAMQKPFTPSCVYLKDYKKIVIQKALLTTNIVTKMSMTNYDCCNSNIIKAFCSRFETVNPMKKSVSSQEYNGKIRKRCDMWRVIALQWKWREYVKAKTTFKPFKVSPCHIHKQNRFNNKRDIEILQQGIKNYLNSKHCKETQSKPIQIVTKASNGNYFKKTHKGAMNIASIIFLQAHFRQFIGKRKQDKTESPRLLAKKQQSQAVKKRNAQSLSSVIFIQRRVKPFLMKISQKTQPIKHISPALCIFNKERYKNEAFLVSFLQSRYRLYTKGSRGNFTQAYPRKEKCYLSKSNHFKIKEKEMFRVIFLEQFAKNYLRTRNKKVIGEYLNSSREINKTQCFLSKTRMTNDILLIAILQRRMKDYLMEKEGKTKGLIHQPFRSMCYMEKEFKKDVTPEVTHIQNAYRTKGRNKNFRDDEVLTEKPITQTQAMITKQINTPSSLTFIALLQGKVRGWLRLNKNYRLQPIKQSKPSRCTLSKDRRINSIERVIVLQRVAHRWMNNKILFREDKNLRRIPIQKVKCGFTKKRTENSVWSIVLIQRICRLLLKRTFKRPQTFVSFIDKKLMNQTLAQVIIIQRFYLKYRGTQTVKPLQPLSHSKNNSNLNFLSKVRKGSDQAGKIIYLQRNIKLYLQSKRLRNRAANPRVTQDRICYSSKTCKDIDAISKVRRLQMAIRLFLLSQANPMGKPTTLYSYQTKEAVESYHSKPNISLSYISKNNIELSLIKPLISVLCITKSNSQPSSPEIKEEKAFLKPINPPTYISKSYSEHCMKRPSLLPSYISKDTLASSSCILKPITPVHYLTKSYINPSFVLKPIVDQEYITKDHIKPALIRPMLHIAFISKAILSPKQHIPPGFIKLLYTNIIQANNEYTMKTLINFNDKKIAQDKLHSVFHNRHRYEFVKTIRLAQKRQKLFYFIHLLKQRVIKNSQELSFEKLQTSTNSHESFDSQLSNINQTKARESFFFQTLRRHLLLNTDKDNDTPEGNRVFKKVKTHLKETVPLFFLNCYDKAIIPKISQDQRTQLEETNIYAANEADDLASYINFCFEKEKKIQNSKKDLILSRLKRARLINTNIFGITRFMDNLFKNALKVTYCPQCYCKEGEQCLIKCYCHHQEEEPDILVEEQRVEVEEIPVRNEDVYCFDYEKEEEKHHMIRVEVTKIEKEENSEDDFDPLSSITRTKDQADIDSIISKAKNSSRRMRTEEEEIPEVKYFDSSKRSNRNTHAKLGVNYRNLLSEKAKEKDQRDLILIRDHYQENDRDF